MLPFGRRATLKGENQFGYVGNFRKRLAKLKATTNNRGTCVSSSFFFGGGVGWVGCFSPSCYPCNTGIDGEHRRLVTCHGRRATCT